MKRKPLTHERVFSDIEYANTYAKQHWKMAENFGKEYAKMLSSMGYRKGGIIDVGCGFGAMNLVLAEQFVESEIVGIDLSEPLLQLAREAAEKAGYGTRVRFESADVQQIPYEDDSFDVAFCVNMVHLVEDPIRMLNEIERVLLPGGLVFIADLRRSWLGLFEREIRAGLTIPEVKKLFNQSELRSGRFKWGILWWKFEAGEKF
jgi:ubiquinone/menaquinone biosynthesis C-methylase UbiE